MVLLDHALPTEGLAGSFIDGAWHWPTSGETLAVTNPSQRTEICRIGRGTAVEVDLAVAAAERARRD
jgi:betaine-aldehyde dehydrogenase